MCIRDRLSVDVKDMPEFFQQPQFDGNSMMLSLIHILMPAFSIRFFAHTG